VYAEKTKGQGRLLVNVREIQDRFHLDVATGEIGLDREVKGGYCGDLLSDVMANAMEGQVWLTIQSHQNIVAVAVLREIAAIILVNGHLPDEDTKAKAKEEGLPILLSPLTAFHLAGQMYDTGIGKPVESLQVERTEG
jgi:predicted transcriptional regulator